MIVNDGGPYEGNEQKGNEKIINLMVSYSRSCYSGVM